MSQDEREEHDPQAGPVTTAATSPTMQLVQAFGLGALVGVVLLGLVWMTVSDVTDDPVWPVDRAGRAGLRGDVPNVDRPQAPNHLQRCATAAGALEAPVRAAGPALKQWELHVGAMNSLVVGAITLQQAKDFWNQTRIGAKARIADFHAAERTLLQEHATCPVAALRPQSSPVLDSCLRQVEADSRTLEAARAAVSTWEMHVKDMDALRSGKLSPTAATQMWLSMWKRGTAELRTFHAAERAAKRETGCRQADSAASRFVRPGARSAEHAVASALSGDLVRAGQTVRGISATTTRPGRSPEAVDRPGAAASWAPPSPPDEADPVAPGGAPQSESPPAVTPTPTGEPAASAPPPIPPTGGVATPAPAPDPPASDTPAPDTPTSDAPAPDVTSPGGSGPHRQDQGRRQDHEPGGT